MMTIPLADVPSQIVTATLAGQSCRLKVYQRSSGVYLDLFVSDTMVIGGALLRDRVLALRNTYFGFVGDLMMIDIAGSSDPFYSSSEPSIGSRFALVYVEAADFAAIA